MRFRQSLLKKWMECPLQAYFSSIAHLPGKQGSKAAFGTVIHKALEHYNLTGDMDSAIRLFLHYWDNPEELGVAPEVWNRYTSFGGLRQRGLDILREYHQAQRWEPRTVVAAEHRFKVAFGEHEFTGTVDLLTVKKNHKGVEVLRVEDYKTNTKKPSLGELALNIQFTVYIYATTQPEFWFGDGTDEYRPVPNAAWWWETLRDTPRRGIWVHLWDNGRELDAGSRDADDFARLYRLCNEIERAVDHHVFVPQIGDACTFCDFANGPCPVELPRRDEREAARLEDAEAWV